MSEQNIDGFIQNILNDLKSNNYIYSSAIPNIELYMDQVTTFMDEHLDILKRTDIDKTLTKTMINNYSKSQILPPTNKKKYSKNHMLLLLMIYYLKPVLSIPDIQAILEPLQKSLLGGKSSKLKLETYYDQLVKSQLNDFHVFTEHVMETVERSNNIVNSLGGEDNDDLAIITVIYMLSIQASMQKHLATQLIDQYLTPEPPVEVKIEKKKEKAAPK